MMEEEKGMPDKRPIGGLSEEKSFTITIGDQKQRVYFNLKERTMRFEGQMPRRIPKNSDDFYYAHGDEDYRTACEMFWEMENLAEEG
jgi:hypothetical protein